MKPYIFWASYIITIQNANSADYEAHQNELIRAMAVALGISEDLVSLTISQSDSDVLLNYSISGQYTIDEYVLDAYMNAIISLGLNHLFGYPTSKLLNKKFGRRIAIITGKSPRT